MDKNTRCASHVSWCTYIFTNEHCCYCCCCSFGSLLTAYITTTLPTHVCVMIDQWRRYDNFTYEQVPLNVKAPTAACIHRIIRIYCWSLHCCWCWMSTGGLTVERENTNTQHVNNNTAVDGLKYRKHTAAARGTSTFTFILLSQQFFTAVAHIAPVQGWGGKVNLVKMLLMSLYYTWKHRDGGQLDKPTSVTCYHLTISK